LLSLYRSVLCYPRAALDDTLFNIRLGQMVTLQELLLSVKVPGSYLEVGAAEGHTTCWLGYTMKEAGCLRRMFVIDTLAGFTAIDEAREYGRGKEQGSYNRLFVNNNKEWFDESMKRADLEVVSFASDRSSFDYMQVGPLGFVLLDVDLYRPAKLALPEVYAQTVDGGIVVADDCNPQDPMFDGAYRAYSDFCLTNAIKPAFIAGKFGIIRKC
jgi:O-methyltransferase